VAEGRADAARNRISCKWTLRYLNLHPAQAKQAAPETNERRSPIPGISDSKAAKSSNLANQGKAQGQTDAIDIARYLDNKAQWFALALLPW